MAPAVAGIAVAYWPAATPTCEQQEFSAAFRPASNPNLKFVFVTIDVNYR
jgi:hypothetical protein